MAYISANQVQQIRKALKTKFPEFKFGARKGSGSYSVEVTIKAGPVDFIKNYNETTGQNVSEGYLGINQYWYQNHFSGQAKDVIRDVLDIIKNGPDEKWYDNSDAMTDYFDTAYYIHLNIGNWNNMYVVTNK